MMKTDTIATPTASMEELFRLAMRRLIATVTIIAAAGEDGRAGMVATAVMSLSADPPALAVGVNRQAGVWEAIRRSGRFSVNLLSNGHAGLILPFSGQLQGEERFTLGNWDTHDTRVPCLADAIANLLCRVDGSLDYGTHTLFIGAVEEIRLHPQEGEPLLWRNGGLANAVPLDEMLS